MGGCPPSLWHRFQRCTLSRGKVGFGRWLTPGFPRVSHRVCTLWDPGSQARSRVTRESCTYRPACIKVQPLSHTPRLTESTRERSLRACTWGPHRATLARHRAIPAARRRPAAALGSIAMRRRVEASSRALRSHGLLRPRCRSAHGASPRDPRAGEPRSPGSGSRQAWKEGAFHA